MLNASTKVSGSLSGIFLNNTSQHSKYRLKNHLDTFVKLNVNSIQNRPFHTTKITTDKPGKFRPVGLFRSTEPERLVTLKGNQVPQKRLGDLLNIANDDIYSKEDIFEEEELEHVPFVVNEILDIGRHTKVLPGGRTTTFSAFVMVGTGNGSGGLGRGRGESVSQAVFFALMAAKKNLITIERHRGCSVSHNATYKFKRTKVIVKACRTGYGIRASPEMRVALEAFGLTDICVITVGRTTNRQALYRALFRGLQTDIMTVENLSKMMGKKYLDLHKFFYYRHE